MRTLWVFVKVIVETRMKTVEKASSATNKIDSTRSLAVIAEGHVAKTTAFPSEPICTIAEE